jgi:hypothetical protein
MKKGGSKIKLSLSWFIAGHNLFLKKQRPGAVAHAYNFNIQKAEAG